MKLLDYIRGDRKGKGAQRIEKDSMTDPFLYEAIEGFDSIEDNHIERINSIQKRLKAKTKNDPRQNHFWQIAATITILIFGLAGYLFIDYNRSSMYAQESEQKIIEIYVPENYYTENIAVIAKKNVELAKAYKPNISQFKVKLSPEKVLSEEELTILMGNENIPIEVYFPEEEQTQLSSSPTGKPEPVIGFERYDLYIKNSLQRPTDDACRNRKGKVVVDFYVNEHGRPHLFEVVQSICGTCDSEALRLIDNGPRWTLGKEKVRVRIEF